MAFGSQAKKMGEKSNGGNTSGEVYIPTHMPTGSGKRIFRVLSEVSNGQVVTTPRLSPNGVELREGNKKTGKVLEVSQPASEVGFMYAWWPVSINGVISPNTSRKLILDSNKRWDNPLWDHIKPNYEKGSKEYAAIKLAFAMNVYDKTPVVEFDGKVWYRSETGWNLQAYGDKGKIETDKTKLPNVSADEVGKPFNQVRIFEGSYGSVNPPGKHLFQQIYNLVGQVEDGDGLIRSITEFDIRLTTTTDLTGAKDFTKTARSVMNLNKFETTPTEIELLPRFDLETWLTPWPDQAIIDLLDGADYNQVLLDYGIQVTPKLIVPSVLDNSETPFDED